MNNPPAFPSIGIETDTEGKDKGRVYSYNDQQGMTLRDYFAIHAPNPTQGDIDLQTKFRGWELSKGVDGKELKLNEKVDRTLMLHSELRYKYADAMLVERSRKDSTNETS